MVPAGFVDMLLDLFYLMLIRLFATASLYKLVTDLRDRYLWLIYCSTSWFIATRIDAVCGLHMVDLLILVEATHGCERVDVCCLAELCCFTLQQFCSL